MELSADPPPIGIGRDGAAMLALSLAIMTLSAGATFAAALLLVWRTARLAPTTAAGIPSRALVLGQTPDRSGMPGAGFRARLDRAAALAARFPALEVIVLGGSTGGPTTEAEAGRHYLVARGVSPARIHMEDRSRHTLENLVQYRARLAVPDQAPPLLITSRFHLARSSLIANGLGLRHLPCAAEDRWVPTLALARKLLMEALLIQWYVTGRLFARLTGNRRMAARVG